MAIKPRNNYLKCHFIKCDCVIKLKEKQGRWPAIFPSEMEKGAKYRKSYQETYNRYYPAVCRQLTYMLGSHAVAEEITQEAFLKLYCTPPRQYQNIGGWISRVATNLAYNYLRSEKSRLHREVKTNHHELTAISSEETALQNEEASLVRITLQTVPERDRLCLLMKHSGFSYDEIAESIGTKRTSVGTIIARAQAKFKKVYLKQKGCEV